MQNEDSEPNDLRVRTKQFVLRVIRLFAALKKEPNQGLVSVLSRQMLRSGTSVGAHYREACRARSQAEFVSKMEGGLQELDETAYWMELLVESKTIAANRLDSLMKETQELLAMFAASVKTAKQRR